MYRRSSLPILMGITSKVGRFAAPTAGGLLLISAHAAVPMLDQYNGPGASVFGAAPTDNWQQVVTAGMSGTLSSISLYSFGGPTSFTVYIDVGLPWHSGANTFETEVTRPWGMEWFSIDVSSAHIQLTTGMHFIIGCKESRCFSAAITLTWEACFTAGTAMNRRLHPMAIWHLQPT
jgi:hypothetical protein